MWAQCFRGVFYRALQAIVVSEFPARENFPQKAQISVAVLADANTWLRELGERDRDSQQIIRHFDKTWWLFWLANDDRDVLEGSMY
jgi:hypothetical protein